MVRLKEYQNGHKDMIETRFNSKMVRLKDFIQRRKQARLSGFNSKMVRLKGTRRFACLHLENMFQFQNGSIKSLE